jgi:hypothetical protein
MVKFGFKSFELITGLEVNHVIISNVQVWYSFLQKHHPKWMVFLLSQKIRF